MVAADMPAAYGPIDNTLRASLEAIFMVVDEPVDSATLAEVVGEPESVIEAAIMAMAAEYEAQRRGFVLRKRGGGWRFWTNPEHHEVVSQFVLHGKKSQLSRAALETLAVVVFKQPITRGQIGAIRGVNPDGAITTLISRGLIEEQGRADLPGRPIVYGPSVKALEQLGINDPSELPSLDSFAPGGTAPPEPPKGDYRSARRTVDVIDADGREDGDAQLRDIVRRADAAMKAAAEAIQAPEDEEA
ncbi:SMC-Scp complex subunit ScpB [Stomatohabitans albus]|uniref:SMC-Scp complex subunit ScpB n=1 Tax=Stomatohabitans albus TaxID=3110766 RepID=UPI00300D7AB0